MRTVLFWDFDGTLAEAPHIWSHTLHRVLLEVAPECGITIADIRRYTPKIFPWDTPYDDHTDAIYGDWWRHMEAQFFDVYQDLGISEAASRIAVGPVRPHLIDPANYRLYPDTVKTLSRCREMGCENYILSNNYPELPEVAHALGLADLVSGFAVSAHIGYDKPRQELFTYAKQLAGDADRYYMIGDNPVADIEGGKAAGMYTILVHRELSCKVDYFCKDLMMIPSIVLL